jgi:hypothetical protein
MRFGSHSHDVEPEKVGTKVKSQRDRLVKLFRELADRIEQAPMDRISDSLAWLAAAAEPLVRVVERASRGDRSKS